MTTVDISTWDTERDIRVYTLPDGRGLCTNGVAALVTPRAIDGAEIAPSSLVTGVNEWLAWPVIARGVRDAIVAALPADIDDAPQKPEAERCRTCDGTGETECGCCEGQGTLDCGNPVCGRHHECDACDGTGRSDCDDCDIKPAKDVPIRSLRVAGTDVDVRYLATLRGMEPCTVRSRGEEFGPMVFDDGAASLVVMPLRNGCHRVGEVTL